MALASAVAGKTRRTFETIRRPFQLITGGKKYIYSFGGGISEATRLLKGNIDAAKSILGGKGFGLHDMSADGLPVPGGFTITTEACKYFQKKGSVDQLLNKEEKRAFTLLEKVTGKIFGDKNNPLLISMRSGAKDSMPGMMDTILNLGLNKETVLGLAKLTGDERFAYDCYRRFIMMFSDVVFSTGKEEFDKIFDKKKEACGVKLDNEVSAEALKEVVNDFLKLFEEKTGRAFPQDVNEQYALARDAVFKSWDNTRARTYRKLNNISEDLGTAVNVQAMVFGNLGDNSATGVGFTRNPATGEKEFYGEFLVNAQGEDVVAGVRTPQKIALLKDIMPEVFEQLKAATTGLERKYKDIQDFEFTIENGKLYLLQTRKGKRTGTAAVKIAHDMVQEKLITKERALMMVLPEQLDQFLFKVFDSQAVKNIQSIAKGLAAGPGAASGIVVFDADEAVARKANGENVILVKKETCADDIHGMHAADGFLTQKGGMTSHAAVVARQMGKTCVSGAEDILVNEAERFFTTSSGERINHGDNISLDGFGGLVYKGKIATIESEVKRVIMGELPAEQSELYQVFSTFLGWAHSVRDIGIRTNADNGEEASYARKLGAEGIGLTRTEHMFFAKERQPIMQKMILAETLEERQKYLDQLLPMQRQDFVGIFNAMNGLPVTIRLIDPPLHEFLPKREELLVEVENLKNKTNLIRKKYIEDIKNEGFSIKTARKMAEAKLSKNRSYLKLRQKEKLLKRVNELHEFNPMLGTRGCRLGIMMPEITQMQTRAIIEAAIEAQNKGISVKPEIMVPLVTSRKEFQDQEKLIRETAEKVMEEKGVQVNYLVGTMIETPRAALTADEIAKDAEFFSYGTNDLTQTTFGLSRDDAGKYLAKCVELGILPIDPFITVDKGVAKLVKMGTFLGRMINPRLKVGVCGEHGGDPNSVAVFRDAGVSYVSPSAWRVPKATLAAAQAKLIGDNKNSLFNSIRNLFN